MYAVVFAGEFNGNFAVDVHKLIAVNDKIEERRLTHKHYGKRHYCVFESQMLTSFFF